MVLCIVEISRANTDAICPGPVYLADCQEKLTKPEYFITAESTVFFSSFPFVRGRVLRFADTSLKSICGLSWKTVNKLEGLMRFVDDREPLEVITSAWILWQQIKQSRKSKRQSAFLLHGHIGTITVTRPSGIGFN